MSNPTLKKRPLDKAMWDVFDKGEQIGAVWYGGGSYWYTVRGFADYPIGHAPEHQAEMTIEKLAQRVQKEYLLLQEVTA